MLPFQVVAALIRQDDSILLVRQQGPADPAPNWAMPGGVVEAGETLLDALSREVREETGLTVDDSGSLLAVAQIDDRVEDLLVTAFTFAVGGWSGELAPADPDSFILEARFLPVDEAIAHLTASQPEPPMRDPVVAYLRGDAPPGAFYLYRRAPAHPLTLTTSLPPDSAV